MTDLFCYVFTVQRDVKMLKAEGLEGDKSMSGVLLMNSMQYIHVVFVQV